MTDAQQTLRDLANNEQMTQKDPSVKSRAMNESDVRETVRRVVGGLADTGKALPSLDSTSASPAPSAEHDRRMAGAIAIGADHGGYALKEKLGFRLKEKGYDVIDCGTHGPESVDYPDFAHAVAEKVAVGDAAYGVIVDGAGIGSAMVANKVPGVRAALCYDLSSARNSREHNHANVLTLGAGLIGSALAQQILDTWLETPWAEGRHANRVSKITEIEAQYAQTAGSMR
jgi:ribose 5-phosphate isomerase B